MIREIVAGTAAMTLFGCNAVESQPIYNVSLDGPEEVVIPAENFSCGGGDPEKADYNHIDVPDAPPRMLRLANGGWMLLAPHHNNIPWYSVDGVNFSRKGCTSILESSSNPNPSAFNDKSWITSFYTKNNRDVFALVHMEYHGANHIESCKKRLKPGQPFWDAVCLQISMNGYVSHDDGKSFSRDAVNQPVLASTNDTLDSSNYQSATRFGLHDPSNIVRNPKDGYFYFVVNADPSLRQQSGTCLLRSKDPLTEPWYAWGGKDFDVRMGSPYAEEGKACTPVRPWGTYISAINYNTVLKRFLAVGRSDKKQLVAITSPDLIHWDKEQILRKDVMPNWWKPFRGDPDPDNYFTLIDPTSSSPYFDVSSKHPYIYYVRFRTGLTSVKWRRRDVMRVRLNVEAN